MVLFPYVVHTHGIMRWLQYLVCRCISAQVDSVDWKQFARALAMACCLPLANLGGLQEIKWHNGISPLIIVPGDRSSSLLPMKECKLREGQLVKHITIKSASKAIQLKCRRPGIMCWHRTAVFLSSTDGRRKEAWLQHWDNIHKAIPVPTAWIICPTQTYWCH